MAQDFGRGGTGRAVLRRGHAVLLPATGLGGGHLVPRDHAEGGVPPHQQHVGGEAGEQATSERRAFYDCGLRGRGGRLELGVGGALGSILEGRSR